MQNNDQILRAQLQAYLENLDALTTSGYQVAGVPFSISTERDLEKFVDLGAESSKTLLRILGYSDSIKHPPLQIGSGPVLPDYLLKHQQKDLAVLELKNPDENIDDPKWVRQLLTYCQLLKTPLGLLFNGKSFRVYINTDDRNLSKFTDLSRQSVASADKPDWRHMAELMTCFSADALQVNPIGLAKRLAREETKRRIVRGRQKDIRDVLKQTIKDEPPCFELDLLRVLASVESLWTQFDPPPNEKELEKAWQSKPTENIGRLSNGAVNPALREKLREVCGVKGWDAILSVHIKGLRTRTDGLEESGYRLVNAGPGVPAGLCVQGKDTPGAKAVIAELDNLLKR